jgi:hypothetical protein
VARVVHVPLAADRPKLRYIVGTRAARMLALLPGELFERLYARVIMRHIAEQR